MQELGFGMEIWLHKAYLFDETYENILAYKVNP